MRANTQDTSQQAGQPEAKVDADPMRPMSLDTAIGGMGASFGQDFSGVRVREEQPAALGGALAVTQGEEIRAAPGSMDQSTDNGRFLLGHELTHVVQQRGGDGSAAQAKDPGVESTDMLEIEADQVGGRVARGESAGPVVGRAPDAPLFFSAGEHQRMGNKGSGNAQCELDDDYELSFGEVVALAGDHFSSIDQMRQFAKNKSGGAHSRLEIEYALKWKLKKNVPWDDGDSKHKEAKEAQEKRYYTLAGGNQPNFGPNSSHFLNPNEGDTGRATGEKALDMERRYDDLGKNAGSWIDAGVGAVANYRVNHVYSLIDAAVAGQQGGEVGSAMAQDAFACHYLTDSFAAGHIRTARTSIKDYWDAKVPMFFYNLVGYMAQQIARHLRDNGEDVKKNVDLWLFDFDIYPDADHVDENRVWKGARTKVQDVFKAKAPLTFGDVVGLACHDWDNKEGVKAHVNGKQETLQGDSFAGAGSKTEDLVSKAVTDSVGDVKKAQAQGKTEEPAEVVKGLFDFTEKMFPAERHIPVVTKEDLADASNPELKWKFGTFGELLSNDRMKAAISTFLGEKAGELDEVKASFDPGEARALEALTTEMKGDPEAVLTKVIHWTPDTGGGVTGDDTDAQAEEYFKEAKKTKGGLDSLTGTQRINLIVDLMNGTKITEPEEETGWSLLDNATPDVAKHIIDHIGWDDLADFFDGAEDTKFRKKFPKDKFAAADTQPSQDSNQMDGGMPPGGVG